MVTNINITQWIGEDQELLVPTAKHFPLSSTAVWLQDDVVGDHSCQNLEYISKMSSMIMEIEH